MRTKNIFRTGILAASTMLLMASCIAETKEAETVAEETIKEAPEGIKIAFVEVDSLMTQYQFCIDFAEVLNKKGENIQTTLANKAKALQNGVTNFKNKIQTNEFTSQEQAEREQAALMKQEQDLQTLQQRLASEFDAEQVKYNLEMRDSIQSFLKEYNKNKKYDFVLSKAGDNILMANPQFDITNEVIAGLNKRYKSNIKTAAENKK